MKIAIVASNFNEEITSSLINGALRCYKDVYNNELNSDYIYKVPGAFEIPSFINRLLDNIKVDAVVTLGCVIKGETAHFEYISKTVTDEIMNLSIHNNQNIPVIYGVLTTLDYQQALARTKQDKSNKGYEVMDSAIYMINQFSSLNK
jgi:6,7-dimethyl-8-ribityllumazine synthase|tara:strand:+ start:266 stop:706 length:441 start_codon:yes stop_codon:yes gene_type:complete